MNRPLISFCIPTYNRSEYLKATLLSYVNCSCFDKRIEIVISDNHSIDDTQRISEEFSRKYFNIKYFRNEENINDANFPLALNRATGEYVKLMNDNIHITEDGLMGLITFIEKNIEFRTPLFCCSTYFNHNRSDIILCDTVDEFVTIVSRSCTGISMFGAWREDWQQVKEPLKYSKLRLSQVDWCYQIINLRKRAVIYTNAYSSKKMDIGMKRSGYNWFEVQVKNYYSIIEPYVKSGLISKRAQRIEKKTCLKNIMPWIATRYWLPMYKEWQFDFNGSTKYLWDAFKCIPLFYIIMGTIPVWANYYFLKYHIRQLFVKLGINVR